MSYVYVHFRLDTGTPFYVGKGSGGRVTEQRKRTSHWRNVALKHGTVWAIVADGLEDEDAFLLEIGLIEEIRAKYGDVLVNITAGGEGAKRPEQVAAHKDEIRKFYAEHGRLPSAVRRGFPEEFALYVRLQAYCKEGESTYDAEFLNWCRSVGYGGRRAGVREARKTRVKQEIQNWVVEHKRFPKYAAPEERRLSSKLANLCSPSSNCFDPDFRDWCLSRGYAEDSVAANKEEIKEFILTHARLPRIVVPEERKLTQRLRTYTKPNGPCFDSEFRSWIEAHVRIGKPRRKSKSVKE